MGELGEKRVGGTHFTVGIEQHDVALGKLTQHAVRVGTVLPGDAHQVGPAGREPSRGRGPHAGLHGVHHPRPGPLLASGHPGPDDADQPPNLGLLDRRAQVPLAAIAVSPDDPDGVVHTSADGGKTWTEAGRVPGRPAALITHGKAEVYVATEAGIHHSIDGGKTFTMFQALE